MSDWKTNAKKLLDTAENSAPVEQNNTPGADNSSGSWKSSARRMLSTNADEVISSSLESVERSYNDLYKAHMATENAWTDAEGFDALAKSRNDFVGRVQELRKWLPYSSYSENDRTQLDTQLKKMQSAVDSTYARDYALESAGLDDDFVGPMPIQKDIPLSLDKYAAGLRDYYGKYKDANDYATWSALEGGSLEDIQKFIDEAKAEGFVKERQRVAKRIDDTSQTNARGTPIVRTTYAEEYADSNIDTDEYLRQADIDRAQKIYDNKKYMQSFDGKTPDDTKSYINSTPVVISDYVPSAYNMTRREYLLRRRANPDMPEFGSYDYFKNREQELRPVMEEISNDTDRIDVKLKEYAEHYSKDNSWAEGTDIQKIAKEAYEKFKYQDAIIAEYKDINEQLNKFDKKGIHYDASGEVDAKSGAEEAKYNKERTDTILNTIAMSNDESAMAIHGDLPEDKQKEYDNLKAAASKRNIEAEKEEAYDYYAKHKDNVYDDNIWGRITGNYKVGRIGIKANDAGFASFEESTDDIEAVEVYQALSDRIQKRNKATFQNNNALEEITAIVSQYVPQAIDQAESKIVGSVIGAALGWTSGMGALEGARSGGSAAVAKYIYNQTAGAAFVRLLQESDLSIEDAKRLADSEARASSAVEFGLEYVTSGLWKGLGTPAKNAVSALGKKTLGALTSIGISEKGAKTIVNIAKNAGKLAVDALGEGTEEWIQEGMSITADRYAAEGKSASPFELFTKSFDLTQYSKEDFSRMNQSFLAGTIIGFGHGGLNAAISLGVNKTVSAAADAVDAKVLGEEIKRSGETELITDAVEMAKDDISPEVANAVKIVETAIVEGNTPPSEAVGTVVKSALSDETVYKAAQQAERAGNEKGESTESVSIGDTFEDTKTGNTITVTERDSENTTVKINIGEKTETREYSNAQADNLITNERFEQIESSEKLAPEERQQYNIAVSNLKRRAEDLGLLDKDFFTALQNVNLYDPSESDRTLISREFHRVLADNTDPLVTSWLDSLSSDTQTKSITLTRNGAFYEAYGDEAAELAKELDLALALKTVNGKKVRMTGFPVQALEEYQNTLSGNYNIKIANTPAETGTGAKNAPFTYGNANGSEIVASADADIADGEILSLKHTKNVYSLFKGANRVVVGEDIISDGFVAMPLTDEVLAEVKKVAGDVIQENPNISLSAFYHKDNDVVIQGNPKTDEIPVKGKNEKAYVFKIGNAFYTCQQKFIDAFNKGKNIITANKSVNIPWTVHDENGEFVALFLGTDHAMSEERFNSLQSVGERKAADRLIKAENANKPFNSSEIKTIVKDGGIPCVFEMGVSKFVTEGHFSLRTDEAGIAQLNETVIPYHSVSDGMQTIPSDNIKKMLNSPYSADIKELIPYAPENEKRAKIPPYYAIVADGIAHQYNKKFVDALKKRSSSMMLTSGGALNSTLLVGYDAGGNITGFVLPLRANADSFVDKDGNKIPFATNDNLKALVKGKKGISDAVSSVSDDAESEIKSEKGVIKASGSVMDPEYTHLYDEEKVSREYLNSVNTEIENAIISIRNGDLESVPEVIDVTELNDNTVKTISELVGFDISDYVCRIERDRLVHIEKRHGVNGEHDRSLSDPKDTARMGYVINNSDNIEWLVDDNGNRVCDSKYNDRNNKKAPVFIMEKRIDGTYAVSQVVPDSKKKTLWIASARIEKAAVGSQVPNAANSPQPTSKTPLNSSSASNNIVSQDNDTVNDSIRADAENNTAALTDKCELIATKHTSTGENLWVVTLKDRLSSEEYKDLSGRVKAAGGYYSHFAKTLDGKSIPGFVFKSEPNADVIKVFNDFFESDIESAPAENAPVVTERNVTEAPTKNEGALKNETGNDIIKKGTKSIADYVADKLSKGEKITAPELAKIANAAFGGTMADNAYTIKDLYDAMELGVNRRILSMEDVSAEKMLELLEFLPTQTKRTEEMVKYQQFSTPPSIAYLANYAANVNDNDIMLEPSAGIGGIAVFAKKDGAAVYVNELDGRRLDILKNMPFDGFFNENAEQLDNILGGEIEPTVIVMNPPFSSSSERNIQNTKIGAKHIEQALKILAPNGRLVAIVGRGMGDDAPAFRGWWKNIKSQYNVRANIRINGKNYNKYGTNFDIQMLVIDKNGATTQTETGYVDTLQELQEKLGDIRDERPAIDYSANEQRTPRATRKEAVTTGETADVGNGAVSDAGSLTNKGKPSDNTNPEKRSDRKSVQSADADSGKPAISKTPNTDVVADTDRGVGTGQHRGFIGNQDTVGVSDSGSGQSDIQTRRAEPRKRVNHRELTDSIFEHYQTQPLRLKNTRPHPAKVSESAAMSAIEPPVITYKPTIPQSVVENGVLSDVQLEAISYAGQSHSQTLPNGNTRGFFLGDGTGIGKGRTIAGMILDNYNQGRKKSLWVTLNSSLVNDAKRDVKALFGNSDLVTQFVGGNKADSVLSTDEAIMVISYSALSKGFDNSDSNFKKIVKWLGKDFDGLIVFDEAHKMGNATATKGARGVKKASQTGLAGIALQEALPKAKVVYSSATGATEVENLRYAERLGLWGDGTAFVTGDDFVSKIKAGGLAAMELIARDMKAMGVYLSRNISYEDVSYDKITHKLTSPQKKIYDELARSWQIVLKNINKALDTTNQSKDGTAKGRALGAFWSSQQRFFNQILTSMQVPSVISDIEKQLADGKSCVIQLVSTNEAAQNEEFARLKAEDLDLDEFDLTPKQMLMSYIENSFPVQQFEEYRDDEGNIRSKPVYDSKGNPVMNREAVRQREELLSRLGSIKVPSSPIDMIINHFGTDLVAENTGRARRVIQKDGKFIEEKIGSKKDADVDAFQNGDKRIIIFSKAGGTGKSYHADRAAKNQQQRVHYLLEAGWQADNAVQGFGRSHRSNQASAPIFKLVTTDLKGQMRFISTIAKRLDQLGAMTKGQRQAGGQGMFSASDNLENSFAADVLAVFYKDLIANRVDGIDDGLAIVEKLGLKEKILDEYNRVIVTAPELREVNKFLNRILSLESSEQNTVFDGYSERLQDATEKATLAGTLDKGLENYKADRIMLNEVQDIREDERSGAKTKYYNLTAEHKIKPVKFEDIATDGKSFVGFYQNKNTGAIRAVMKTSSTTDQYGNVTDNYKLIGQVKNDYIAQSRFNGNWSEIESAEAEKLWDEELSKLPEFRKENLHLISGVVLPVWDKLPTENVRIYRVLTSDGEMLIGRVIPEDMIDETLRRLGSSRTKEKIATKDLVTGIKNGDTVYLENDWKIVQRKVSGENRIEVVGPSYEHYDLLTKKGVFTERIQYNTRYFVPAETNTEKIIDEILKFSPVMRVENVKYSLSTESEGQNDGQSGNDLLYGDGKRRLNASARKQAKRISEYKQKLKGKTAAERKSTAEELLAKGLTEEKIDGEHKYNLVKPEGYNDDMLSIIEEARSNGKDVGFFIGNAQRKFDGQRDFLINGIYESDSNVLVRYDGEISPQTLIKHEAVHDEWENPEMQKAKDIILSDISDAEKEKLLSSGRYKDYLTLYEGGVDKVWEEFVADVFADMNDYAPDYIDTVVDYWYDGKVIDKFSPAEYSNTIDAGGNAAIIDDIGFIDEYQLTERSYESEQNAGNHTGGVGGISAVSRNQGRGDTSNQRHLSDGQSEVANDEKRSEFYEGKSATKSGTSRMVHYSKSSESQNAKGGSLSDGRRFIEAIKNGDETTARNLLDKQALKNGFTAMTVYHGTHADSPFTEFRGDGGAYWVSKNLSYSEGFARDYIGEASSLFTYPDSGIYDLYVKTGRILDVGNTERAIETLKDLLEFAEKIGFSKQEIIPCWSKGRKYESKKLWTVTVTPEFAQAARRHGYDSLKAVESEDVETYGILYSENLKSAKTVTYDDNGDIIPLEERFNPATKDLRYSLSTAESDAEELTPERKKQIFEQFDKDRAEVPKPTQKQLWGERAAWVAHNMTRVFPNIPERGERGTFFAEFRKSMIQWKNLPTTASFMVQDKLNKMTEGLTPKEFKTFSELVYFLDLQEEAQIQKERGYTEILLPNEITSGEVDAIVKVLNEEATDNVRQALIKRQNIWDALKSQYIDLNRYIGFDTDGKFKRKNYYHHQVIEYMSDGGKGTGSREIGIKAGRGWLKERQGSTKAINTDFLAVEYKAMLQMQYDVYIAETLGRIKRQYDIKPQLEDEARRSNKKHLNDIIAKECTDKDGNMILDSKGKPDSETYRRQMKYNSRIMFGFNGLFDLANRNELPNYNGEYASVVEALKRHDLNVPGLYKYVGIIANADLTENATDAQEMAVLNARTVLKYTSQKKAWIKELLTDDYQTWETIAKSMSDTHTIHQPRRGNYFYTKTVIDEDAFNKAHDEMVLSLISGEIDLGNDDLNKLFTQYADTVRLTGAAYEQWVLPNEIVSTMDEIANPKQARGGTNVARAIVSAWKGWATSINPLRTVKFGLRNMFGDLDAVIAGNPKVTLYSKKAVQEIYQAMRHKNYSPEYMEWIERGGYTSMIFANEMDSEMQDKLFSHLKEKQGVSVFKIPVKLFEKYNNGVENVHNFREAILRYSAYLYFKEAVKRNGGNVNDYVASNKYIVRGLNSVEDKAYQLSKDLLGAYDEVGKMGQTLRRYWVPFYSFTETNLKRYYRMFENIITSDDRIPKKAGKLLLKALMVNMLGLLIGAWNKLVMKEEDDKLPPSVRNIPHLTLGKIGDDIYAFRQLGSFSELLEWFGLDDYKWSSEDMTAPLDKAWGMVTPFLKMPVELASGLNFYPSLTHPRAIRDKWQHFFNSLGVDSIYNEVTGKPTRGVGEILKGSVVYSYDYKESAYYEILDIKREFQGKNDNTIYGSDAKSNALYYMKTAVRYKDKEAALKYLDEYFKNGGTVKGIKQSFAKLNPMYGFTSKDTIEKGEAFIASLTDDEKEKLKIAQDYYENDLMLPETVLNAFGKKDITDEEAKNVLKTYINTKCR